MKYLTKGIALSMFAAAATVVAAPAVTQSMMGVAGLHVGVAVKGVFAKRDVKMTTSAQTMYTTRFVGTADNGNVFTGNWGAVGAVAAGGNAGGAADAGITRYGVVAQNAAVAAGHTVQQAIDLVRTGVLPAQWSTNVNAAGPGLANVAAAAVPAVFAGINNSANVGMLDEGKYAPKAEHTANMDLNMFGIRGVLEVGYDVSEDVMIFVNAGYMYQFEDKNAKDEKEVSYEVKDDAETDFTAVNGNATFKKKGLTALPFAWNKGHLTSGLKAKASVKETFSVVGGLTWKPSDNIGLSAFAGVRRYELAVSWEGGSWAYPGNPNLYVEAFRTESNVSKFLIKNEKKHELTAINWALVFGGEFLFMINEHHNVTFGISYSSFDAVLHAENKSSSDSNSADSKNDSEGEEFLQVAMANPIGAVGVANMAIPTGWHMLDATNVSTKLTGKLEVTDLTFTLGYKLCL